MICKNQKPLISDTATANERTIAAKVEEEWIQAQIALFDAIGKEAYAEMVATVLLGSRGNIHIRKRHLTAARKSSQDKARDRSHSERSRHRIRVSYRLEVWKMDRTKCIFRGYPPLAIVSLFSCLFGAFWIAG